MARRRTKTSEDVSKKIVSSQNEADNSKIKPNKNSKDIPIFGGPLPSFRNQKFWARFVVLLGVICIVYFTSTRNKERKFAPQRESIQFRHQKFICAPNLFRDASKSSKCIPTQCGRFVSDSVIALDETDTILRLAKNIFKLSGLSTGISVFDLHSGDLSKEGSVVNLFNGVSASNNIFSTEDMYTLKLIRAKIQKSLAETFLIDEKSIYLANPALLFDLNNGTSKTSKDEYWHPHIDKDLIESYHYTTHLFLNDFNKDFQGGRFVFSDGQDHNKTLSFVESRKSRVLYYTSGKENFNYIEKVTSGYRYVLYLGFTCNKEKAGLNPSFNFNH